MKTDPINKITLPEKIAGKLARSILSEEYPAGSLLPSERKLIKLFEVGRSSLREALTILAEANIITSQQGIGWFVNTLDTKAQLKSRKLIMQVAGNTAPISATTKVDTTPLEGPRRLPPAKEKPIRIPNLKKDKLGTFSFISWWEREKMKKATVMVVGAGALGNEVVKNLALMGVGNIFILDFDTVEIANLSRSILFRDYDNGKQKAKLVAARAKEINSELNIQYFHGDVMTDVGLGLFRKMDVIIGCLDNREARLAVNRFAFMMKKPWVDGAIQELLGLMRVFIPGEGACFECTLTDQARRDIAVRYSCPLLARKNILLGKVPTTPTIASIIGAMQAQEALKLIHGMNVEPGKVTHFNGLTNHMHTTAYVEDHDCESHWIYGDITELPLRAETATLQNLLDIAKSDLGPDAIIELDQELILSLECTVCKVKESVRKPISEVSFEMGHCPTCGEMRVIDMTHVVDENTDYLHHTLLSVGIPPLHIVRANNGVDYRFYELTGDLPTTLHFSHFEGTEDEAEKQGENQVRLGKKIEISSSANEEETIPRIRFKDN
jgi:molybdopterin/thiamine biosynthesis adenylyltransferase/DNA-binding transcriptional regulator YhcF (GntR family)